MPGGPPGAKVTLGNTDVVFSRLEYKNRCIVRKGSQCIERTFLAKSMWDFQYDNLGVRTLHENLVNQGRRFLELKGQI